MGNRKIASDSQHGQRTSLQYGTWSQPTSDSIRTVAAFHSARAMIRSSPSRAEEPSEHRDNFTSPYWLVTEFNSFLVTDIKFVKGDIIKHLFLKIRLPWASNSREGFICMVSIHAFTIVKFTETDSISPIFCKKVGYKSKTINGTGETGRWLCKSEVWLTVHRNSVWIRNQLDVTFVLSFISPLQVAQHVSGNHVPIIRSWRLR